MIELTDKQLDGLAEIVNIGIGSASSSLNEIVNAEIELKLPIVEIVDIERIVNDDIGFSDEDLSCVKVSFSGNCNGIRIPLHRNQLRFPVPGGHRGIVLSLIWSLCACH